MKDIRLPQDAWVFVGDGTKALFLRNAGDEKFPNLVTERVFEQDNPKTHEQGTDRPGRMFRRAKSHNRSAVEPTDWHEIEEQRFARHVAEAMEVLVREENIRALVVVAPPRTLAELRDAFNHEVKGRIIAEVDKNLTNHPVGDIEKLLLG